jgi:TolB protein
MKPLVALELAALAALTLGCTGAAKGPAVAVESQPQERHLKNLRQITFGGQNAEAYWSTDGRSLIFQSTRGNWPCDQIYTMKPDGSDVRLVSTGKGRCTCGYYYPEGKRILFSSTHLASADCPPRPDYSRGYVWPVYASYDIFTANPDGSNLKPLTDNPDYDAEATITTDGQWIAFTSLRNGDLDVYRMRADGSEVTRLTNQLGYDGGPFWSRDGKKIVYRASHPSEEADKTKYLDLLSQHLILPQRLDLWVMDADGSNNHLFHTNGAGNFAPYFFPDGKRVIFASNVHDPQGRNFDLYAVNLDGSNVERITFNDTFDSFPMFSPDGKHLVFSSGRQGREPHELNLFVADWVE